MVLSERDKLIISLIELAFSKQQQELSLSHSNTYYSDARLVEEVKQGHIDLMWSGASEEMESALRPIRIPLFKGLMGYRVFIVEKSNQYLFSGVDSLSKLTQFKAGLGRFWGDTKILENAGITVIKPVKAESLFYMVDGGRFDYLPLAAHEAWEVVETHPELNLAVDTNLLLIYPLAMYLYVDKGNESLYNILNQGLEQAIADGSFDQVFLGSKLISRTLDVAKFQERKAIHIANPLLPKQTPLERKELWFDLEKLY
ncbi:hypothetical protein GCM10007414_25610 [Agarivorans gilvus]|uniref:Diguanylate cyclase n=3 Tax=Agarivorans gilvus TaxID=680279 RepID=A0ABQ1I2T3_9ALTE|nr:hypothetical protein GCM10007414_25610 [Agarivorans gilvus]